MTTQDVIRWNKFSVYVTIIFTVILVINMILIVPIREDLKTLQIEMQKINDYRFEHVKDHNNIDQKIYDLSKYQSITDTRIDYIEKRQNNGSTK